MKKYLALLMSAILMVSCVFAGCSSKEETNVTLDANGAFVPTNELPIEIWYTQGTDFTQGSGVKDDVVSEWVYERTKVKVNSVYGNDNGQWDTKLSRLVAGDNLPHIIACGAGQGPSHFAKLKEYDLVWEITDEMLEKYAPNYLKRVPATTIDKFRIDGKLYGLPYEQYSSSVTNPTLNEDTLKKIDEYIVGVPADDQIALWIRDDILQMIYPETKSWKDIEKLAEEGKPIGDVSFDIPITTKEEFVDFFYKIKELNLTAENGKPVYAYGYSGGDNWEALTYLGAYMEGYAPFNYAAAWNSKTNEMVLPIVSDMCKAAVKTQNKMIREGVIDPESLVHTSDLYKEKALNGQYAIFAPGYAGSIENVNASLEEQGASYRMRPFVVNIPNDEEFVPGTTGLSLWSSAICFTKTTTENELIQLLNYVNVCCSEEFDEVFWWGPKEAGLYTEENGVRRYVDERFNKRFIDGNIGALEDKETRGLGGECQVTGTFYINAVIEKQNAYAPTIYNKTFRLPPYTAVTKFTTDSPHAVTKKIPGTSIWGSEYAGIPECVEFWAKREKWENAFKVVFTANSDAEFEKKWDSAVKTVDSIIDVKEMEKKMTEVARKQLESFEE